MICRRSFLDKCYCIGLGCFEFIPWPIWGWVLGINLWVFSIRLECKIYNNFISDIYTHFGIIFHIYKETEYTYSKFWWSSVFLCIFVKNFQIAFIIKFDVTFYKVLSLGPRTNPKEFGDNQIWNKNRFRLSQSPHIYMVQPISF